MLTPHAGELARLIDVDSDWVAAHRLEAVARCAERFGAVVLLKGAGTIVRSHDGRTVVCDTGPPSLATAGTGDVLTGILGAFRNVTPLVAPIAEVNNYLLPLFMIVLGVALFRAAGRDASIAP